MNFVSHYACTVSKTFIFLVALIASTSFGEEKLSNDFLIGGYGGGIYHCKFDSTSASFSEPKLLLQAKNASFFCQHPTLPIIYSVRETMRNDSQSGNASLTAIRIDRKPIKLEVINSQPIDGDIPCHVTTDANGRFAVVSNYTSGSVIVFPINADGSLGKMSDSVQHLGVSKATGQSGPRAHCSVFDPTGKFLLVCDLGKDQVMIYRFDFSSGRLTPGSHPFLDMPPGSGPRHLTFHPDGKHLFIINELGSTLSFANWDADFGQLDLKQSLSTLPTDFHGGNSTAEVLVHPNGKFVFGSNRGDDSIASFGFDTEKETLSLVGHCKSGGKTPRNFRITPDGDYILAENQQGDSVHLLKIDLETGRLTATGKSFEIPAPACIRFIRF